MEIKVHRIQPIDTKKNEHKIRIVGQNEKKSHKFNKKLLWEIALTECK